MSQYKGIAFPFQSGNLSFPAAVSDDELIRQSIIQILLTERGERIYRPDFGAGVMARVFNNNDAGLATLLQAEVYAAIGKWEPRAIVQQVDVTQEDTTITITINYIVVSTKQPDSVSLQIPTPM